MTNELYREKAAKLYAEYHAAVGFRRKVLLTKILRVALWILWYVLWGVSAMTYFARDYATFNSKNAMMYIAGAILILLPFKLFRPIAAFRDVTFPGTITGSTIKTVTKVQGYQVRSHAIQYKTVQILKIKRLDNQKIVTLRLPLLEGMKDLYYQGDTVLKFAGVPYPVSLDRPINSEDGEYCFCYHCGHLNAAYYTRCFECSNVLLFKSF